MQEGKVFLNELWAAAHFYQYLYGSKFHIITYPVDFSLVIPPTLKNKAGTKAMWKQKD